MLGSMATALSAAGPNGAVPAGLSTLMGTLLGSTLGDASAPEPLDIQSISGAMASVVDEALHKDDAREAASLFLQASQWLVDMARTAHSLATSAGSGQVTGSYSEGEFRKGIEKRVQFDEPFMIKLFYCQNNPDVSKFILPAFCTGLVTSLHFFRFHDIIRNLAGEPITPEDLANFNKNVDRAVISLTAARDALVAYATQKISDEKLTGCPEADKLRKLIYKIHTGAEDLSFVDKALTELDCIKQEIVAERKEMTTTKRAPRYTGPHK